MRILKRTTELLACQLKPSEFERRASALAKVLEDYKAELTLQQATKQDMKAKLTELERQRDELGRIVSRKAEDRLVEVELRADDSEGLAYYVRMDTGEIHGERALKAEERQLSLIEPSSGPDAMGIETITLTTPAGSVTATPEKMRKALDQIKGERGRSPRTPAN